VTAPRLEVIVRPCRWGWESNVRLYLVGGLRTTLGVWWWRPTRRAAIATAYRFVRRSLAQDARYRRTETIPVEETP
jgi:hypothetical protein